MKQLEIKKNDLTYNIDKIRNLMQERAEKSQRPCKIIAVVKGNGYGMGLIEYAKFLVENGIDIFAVSTLEEAIELRQAGIKEDILMLSSTSIKEEVEQLIDNNIILTIGSRLAGEVANTIAEQKDINIRVHLKIDTGFGRYGFLYSRPLELLDTIDNMTRAVVEGCYTHFSEAYSKKSKWTCLQFKRFMDIIEWLKKSAVDIEMLHVCNSSAFLKYDYMDLDAVRIGSALTGRISVENKIGLKKIGTFKAQISEIKTLPKNYNIGYSNTFKTKKETRVAIVPVGYFDGFNMGVQNDTFRLIDHIRNIYHDIKNVFKKNKITVTINDAKYEILGRIGMFHIAVDIKEDDIIVSDTVIIDAKPIYIDNKIRREYI